MLAGKKVALFGIGHIGRAVFAAGVGCLSFCESAKMKDEVPSFLGSVKSLVEYRDFTTLVDSYKKVKRKYYPERDLLIKKK